MIRPTRDRYADGTIAPLPEDSYSQRMEDYADDLEQQLEAIITADETEIEDPSCPFDVDDSDVVSYDEEEYAYDRPALNDLQTKLVMGYFCEKINDNLTSLWELIGETGVDDEY